MNGYSLTAAAVIPAAGMGARLGGNVPKALRSLGGRSLLDRSIDALIGAPEITQVVVAAPVECVPLLTAQMAERPVRITVVPGGDTRQASVAAALAAIDPAIDVIVVHDAARPLVPLSVVNRVLAAIAAGAQAAVPGLPVVDTIKRIDDAGLVVETPPRHSLRAVQTPQAFRRGVLLDAHHRAPLGECATDDAALVELAGYPVMVVAGDPAAMKITGPEDLERAERLLALRGDAP